MTECWSQADNVCTFAGQLETIFNKIGSVVFVTKKSINIRDCCDKVFNKIRKKYCKRNLSNIQPIYH